MSEEFSIAEDLSRNVEIDVTEEQVAKYLQQNPKFFLHHHELLSKIKLPHESGKAISLVEKQVNILREQGIEATKKLKDLLENARSNDEIFDTTKTLILALLNAENITEICISVQEQFTSLTNVDACEIILVDHPNLGKSDAIRTEKLEAMIEEYRDVFRLEKTYCGQLRIEQVGHVFQSSEKSISSTALCPVLRNGKALALLALGNKTDNYFNIHLDTLFLDFICQVLGSRIFSLLDKNDKKKLI